VVRPRIVVLAAAFVAAGTRDARANELSDAWAAPNPKSPIDLEIACQAGYGSVPFNLGFGGRAGVSVFGIYAGASVVDYLGGKVATNGIDVSMSFLTYGGEVGYGLKLGVLTIRPLFGLGWVAESFPSTESPGTGSGTFYLQPGGLVELTFGHFIFGIDAAALIPTSAQVTDVLPTFTIHGQLGLTFGVPLPPGTSAE